MKKIVILLSVLVLTYSFAESKDYVRMQVKEMQHAQKYGTTQKVLQNKVQPVTTSVNTNISIKDPKIMKFGNYDKISKTKYNEKLKKDENKYKEYEKLLSKKHNKYYTTQADAEDFYKVYRVAEKLIRANKLDYMNWRIAIKKNVDDANAYTDGSNLIVLNTAMFDSFSNNDDALAFVIGHEMGHVLLGHNLRKGQLINKMNRQYKKAKAGNEISALLYAGMKRKMLIDSKNMEYAADVEGTKLLLHAGFNPNIASDVITFLANFDYGLEYQSTHPGSAKRLENFNENRKYFPEEWNEQGEYNIYNSDVLPVQLSSDRKSIVISASKEKLSSDKYYSPESMPEMFARLGYMYYINGKFEKSLEYFGELFKIDQTNAPAYLYASYAGEYLYNNTKNAKYLTLAKEYANKAKSLDSKNKYIKEQVNNL